MKKIYLLYSIAILVVAVLLVDFISYAINSPTVQKGVQDTQVGTVTSTKTKDATTVKKKPCSCCAERRERRRELVQRARERNKLKNNTGVKVSSRTRNGE